MRHIEFEQIVDTVGQLCIKAAHNLPVDVIEALQRARASEDHPGARKILEQLLENAEIASQEVYPLCQDTGLTVVFVDQGKDVQVTAPADKASAGLDEAINAGVSKGYGQGYLRKSIVADPLQDRLNTGDNTPAVIHHRWVDGQKLTLAVMLKGAGCENRSQFRALKPAEGPVGVEDFVVQAVVAAGADACPPFVVGVGIGGDFEKCCQLSKHVLLRALDRDHSDPYYRDMERRLLDRINRLGIGPQGLGGRTTALAVMIETHPCHIASLPVAVNIECHSHRHATEEL